jgi:hypothetical protein
MPIPTLLVSYRDFDQAESRITDLISRSASFLEQRGGSLRHITAKDKYLVTEICFLRLLLEWEIVVEEFFSRMLCRAQRNSPPQPGPLARFSRIDDAKRALRGGRGFVRWINPDEVLRLAPIYFRNGEPFASPFRAAYQQLNEVRIIRNRVAHSSARAKDAFLRLMRDKYGYNPRGMTPGRYLLDRLPSNPLATQYLYYAQTLRTVADLIIG